jgi:hypothetical protein
MKEVKFVESLHVWEGTAIVKEDGAFKEIPLGSFQTDKKLKETGANEDFKKMEGCPKDTIAIQVKKLEDVSTTYVMDSEEFMKVAKALKSETTENETSEPVQE